GPGAGAGDDPDSFELNPSVEDRQWWSRHGAGPADDADFELDPPDAWWDALAHEANEGAPPSRRACYEAAVRLHLQSLGAVAIAAGRALAGAAVLLYPRAGEYGHAARLSHALRTL